MGDLGVDSAVEGGDGRYRAELSEDWKIWGPNGGYLATILLRTAGAHTDFGRPASLSCHFLGVADFDEVELHVTTLRAGRRSESMRVSMHQGDRPICEALVWAVADDAEGVEMNGLAPPDVPSAAELASNHDLRDAPSPYPFWDNLDQHGVDWMAPDEWQKRAGLNPEMRCWLRLRPTAVFGDAWLEAGRVAIAADLIGFPALHRGSDAALDGTWMAPNLDVAVSFAHPPGASPYLFLDGFAPAATGGIGVAHGTVWNEAGQLCATTTQQLLVRMTGA